MQNTSRCICSFADQLPGMGPFRAISCYRRLWGSHHLVCTCDHLCITGTMLAACTLGNVPGLPVEPFIALQSCMLINELPIHVAAHVLDDL